MQQWEPREGGNNRNSGHFQQKLSGVQTRPSKNMQIAADFGYVCDDLEPIERPSIVNSSANHSIGLLRILPRTALVLPELLNSAGAGDRGEK